MSMRLVELADIIRSKNAGPYELTLDVIFPDMESYERVRMSGALSREGIATAYGISPKNVLGVYFFAPAKAFKATLVRPVTSGSIGDTDVFGAQQHGPLLDLIIH